MGIKWDDTQKVTQAVDEMYSSGIFDKKCLMEWEEYAEVDKDWKQCKDFFKSYYKKEKRFGGTQAKRFEQAANWRLFMRKSWRRWRTTTATTTLMHFRKHQLR